MQNKFEVYLSKQRLESYDNDRVKHKENLRFIGSITSKIAILEISIRNLIDNLLSKENSEWLREYDDEKIQGEIKELQRNGELSHHQLLSRLTLGKIIYILRDKQLESKIFDLEHINFKDYDNSNRKYFTLKGKKVVFSNVKKANIFLNLLWSIRNRCCHWENLLKTRKVVKNEVEIIYPRITTRLNGTDIGIHPNKIKLFLDDFLSAIDKDLLDCC